MNNLEFELESLKLLRQHAQGKYKHLSKDIILSNWQTLKEYLDALDITIAEYEVRISALEAWGGGWWGSSWGLVFNYNFEDYFKNIREYKLFFQDHSKNIWRLELWKEVYDAARIAYYSWFITDVATLDSLLSTFMWNDSNLRLQLKSTCNSYDASRIWYYSTFLTDLSSLDTLTNMFMWTDSNLRLSYT